MILIRQTLLMTGLLVGSMATVVEVHAQNVSSAATSIQAWRHTSQGLSPNAALAFYRVQNVGSPQQQASPWRRQQYGSSTTIYSAPYYTITTQRSVPTARSYYPASSTAQTQKPFANLQPAPSAIDRYWPLLLEAREDPATGLVIWTLP